jgi:hypothetical protein
MLSELHEQFNAVVTQVDSIKSPKFQTKKKRIIIASTVLAAKTMKAGDREELVKSVLQDGNAKSLSLDSKNSASTYRSSWKLWPNMTSWLSTKGASEEANIKAQAHDIASKTSDADFMSSFNGRFTEDPSLKAAEERAIALAYNYFKSFIAREVGNLISCAQEQQEYQLDNQIKHEISLRREARAKDSLLRLIQDMENEVIPDPS